MNHFGYILAGLMIIALPAVWFVAKDEARGLQQRLDAQELAARRREEQHREEIAGWERRLKESNAAHEEDLRQLRERFMVKMMGDLDRVLDETKRITEESGRITEGLEKAMTMVEDRSAVQAPSATATLSKTEPADSAWPASVARMLNSPAMKEQVQLQAERTLDLQWRPFLESLDPALRGRCREMMLAQGRRVMETGMSLLTAQRSPEEKQSRIERMIEYTKAGDAEMLALLGPQNYESYKAYRKTIPVRQQFADIEESGFKIKDAARREQLVGLLKDTLLEKLPQQDGATLIFSTDPEFFEIKKQALFVFVDRSASSLNQEEARALRQAVEQKIRMDEAQRLGLVAFRLRQPFAEKSQVSGNRSSAP